MNCEPSARRAAIPVIVVTAKDLDDEDRRRLSVGVAAVLHKNSVSREALLARILADVCQHVPCADGTLAGPKEERRG